MILFGKPVVESIYKELNNQIKVLKGEGKTPSLAVILVGEDPASLIYVKKKEEIAQNLGINFFLYHFSDAVSEKKVEDLIDELNNDSQTSGVIIQLPLPGNFDTEKLINKIVPEKDIDGLTRESKFHPATAEAILDLLDFYKIDLKNKKIVLVGRGKLVGGPLEKILKEKSLNFTVCDSKTSNLKEEVASGDIVISGVGHPGLISSDMVKPSAVVIDAGTTESSGKTAGDVNPEAYEVAESYTPVPGGVGPITVAMLMKNVVKAAKTQ